MKTVLYQGTEVATNTQLYQLLQVNNHREAQRSLKEIDQKFLADWPEDLRHLLDYAIGRENINRSNP